MTVTTDRVASAAGRGGVQISFDELGTPLRDVTFVVVDLETTGGSPAAGSGITEIGAVKVRGGEVLGEFHTMVDPGEPIPAFIAVLTGITDADVAGAPRIGAALPAFLEFARGTVLVAHNAPFDVGFLKAAAAAHHHVWPAFSVVDTVRLARRTLSRDEAPNCKLGTLARVLGARTTPTHRALDDARATVDVLHALLERVGPLGVQTLEELQGFGGRATEEQRRKRHLAEHLPDAAGVYVFEDDEGGVLYVGRSKSLRRRARSYFTASETRGRMKEMVRRAASIKPIVCATELEAQVREVRLIAAHKPRFNRRSRNPGRAVWLKLTVEPFPRFSIVSDVRDDGTLYLGPFRSKASATSALEVLHDTFPLRQCTSRLSPSRPSGACVLADLGRCGAPCDGREDLASYAMHVAAVNAAVASDLRAVVDRTERRLQRLADEERFEEAAQARDRTAALVRAVDRWQRMTMLAALPELVAGRPRADGGWDLAVVRHGRLAGSAVIERGRPPRPVVDATIATAETVEPRPGPLGAGTAEELGLLLRWIDSPGTRLVELTGTWASAAPSVARHTTWLAAPRVEP